ncbi:MAG: hypothetical protein D6743_01415 [Calditrichaeota bacterium]|nr:MAG: hypothetical protein D6743_01415 [Calditrichota bacterium]
MLGRAEFPVMSKHHQGIRELAPGWTQVGRAPDGVPEAIENPHHPWMVAVLWHPEMALEDETQMKLFRALVARAREVKK